MKKEKTVKKNRTRKMIYLGVFNKDMSIVYRSKEKIPAPIANQCGDS